MRRFFTIITFIFCCVAAMAQQRFVYLTTEEVSIDSILPHVGYQMPLPADYSDSTYTVTLLYPEYIPMAPSDIEKYNSLSGKPLPEIPQPEYSIVFDRKKPILKVGVTPLAFRDGAYKFLSSFMLRIESAPVALAKGASKVQDASASRTYAEHSVLASGRWAKIRVSETGVHQLTDAVIRKAGFNNLSKVKIYGYGGNLQPEALNASYLASTDDLKQVEQCIIDGKHLFYAKGPVSYNTANTTTRVRNPYSNYGYYFITENDEEVATIDSTAFVQTFYRSPEVYHSLYEVDGFAWFSGGRNLQDPNPIEKGDSRSFTINNTGDIQNGRLFVAVTAGSTTTVEVAINDSIIGTLSMRCGEYDKGSIASKTYNVYNLKNENKVTIKTLSGGPSRLDYICLTTTQPRNVTKLTGRSFPEAEYVYNITNQDHHADGFADMVIIIPTSQKTIEQALCLKEFHEEHDGMRVTIVPADELYNEFSSGTPDANAYRRYMKMLYDRAETEADMPKYLLLFGDCVWDNRMMTLTTSKLNPDDYLLCFESEDSYNEVSCYVDDGFFCYLDDGEGANPQSVDMLDISVGRFPVTTVSDAKTMVDKTIRYAKNENAGAWQNVIMFMGDDGNNNLHMDDANDAAEETIANHPGYVVKKVMWDAYERVSSASGNTYPEVTNIIKAQQQSGALIMDYAGHGSQIQVSHERVLRITDFAEFSNTNLPLWITASCDIMPFDGTDPTIGETAVLNSKGGAVAFFGTTRTVYATYNKRINMAFLRYVLSKKDGQPTTIGEAQRLAKNYMITSGQDRTTNKLQFSLLGDPAIALNQPKMQVVVDAINGQPIGGTTVPALKAGSVAKISGHVVCDEAFDGIATATVRDSKEELTCRLNDNREAEEPFVFTDRTKTLFTGSDSVKDGKFEFTFAVPKDINYSDESGLINVFVVSNDKKTTAHGYSEEFIVGGTESLGTDSIGPSIYCYLNSPSFVNGGQVNSTPYFVAEINDEDGINTTGNGIGHDLILIIDGEMTKTYNLNEHFTYDFGSYTSGSTYYSIPKLEPGKHTLTFRAWDIFNNPSTTQLQFTVVSALEPKVTSVSCTNNPAKESTTFIINHDRMGSIVDVTLDIMDMSGRLLWSHSESGVSSDGSYTIDWDLTVDGGQQLQTGVYLYRARVSSEGSDYDSKAKKLIIIR